MPNNQTHYHLASVSVSTAQEHAVTSNQSTMFTDHTDQFQTQYTISEPLEGVSGGQSQIPQTHHVTPQSQQTNEIYTIRQPPAVTVEAINLEQCCVCSTFYDTFSRSIPQPDLNRIISKVMDVIPEVSFFREYLSLCSNCTNLLRKFDRLRVELEFVKTQIVTYVVESLTQVRADGGSQLDGLKDEILDRWTSGSGSKKKGKEGYTATGTTELSWAAHNNITKSSSIVTPIICSWKVGPGQTVVEHPPSSPVAIEYVDDHGGDDFLHASDGENSNSVHEIPDETLVKVNDAKVLATPGGQEKSLKRKRKRKSQKQIKKKRDGDEVVPQICGKCGRIFDKGISLRHHTQACVSDDLGLQKTCSVCLEEQHEPCLFSTWEEYKAHVDTFHPLVKLDICSFCRMRFLPYGLKNHLCAAHPYGKQVANDAIFKCDRCDRAYNSRNNLVDHVRRTHKDEEHKCDTCGRVYGSPMLLRFHVERHNRVVSKFKCRYCGVCLSSGYSLKEHTKRHTGDQPYECKVCGKKFSNLPVYKSHLMVHSNKKPHVCHICGTGFKLKPTLSRHIARHEIGETLHTKKCPLCPKAIFRKIWILKKHMENEHKGTPELEEVIEKYKDVDDAPKVLDIRRSMLGKGRAFSPGNYKGKARNNSDDDQDKYDELELDDEDEESANGDNDNVEVSEVKPVVKDKDISITIADYDGSSATQPQSRKSARVMGQSKTKKLKLVKVSDDSTKDMDMTKQA